MNPKRVLAVVLFSCVFVTAVSQASTLVGSVSDNFDMTMPGVTVTITNQKSSENHTATTNDRGVFRVPDLPPGKYSIQTYMPGFKTTQLSNVSVNEGKDTKVKLVIAIGVD